jgi:mannose-6-phosphate isomerase-like protein (cupin superfamily)
MTDYTIKNLKGDIEDSATQFGYAPDLEAHFAKDALELEHSGISYQRLAPGFRIPFGHKHPGQEEVYVIVSGSGRVKLDDEVVEVKPWDAVRVAKDTMRDFEAGPDGMELIAFGAPSTGPNDAQMEFEWWANGAGGKSGDT